MLRRTSIREKAVEILTKALAHFNNGQGIPVYNMKPMKLEAPAVNLYTREKSNQIGSGIRENTLYLTVGIIIGDRDDWAKIADEVDEICDSALFNTKEFTDLFEDIENSDVEENIYGQGEIPLCAIFHTYEIKYKTEYGIVFENPKDQQVLQELPDFNTIHTDIKVGDNKIEQTINMEG